MKKLTLFIAVLSFGIFAAKAQQPQIPNASFENWTTVSWGDSLSSWTTQFTLLSPIILANKSTTYYEGQYALEATSQSISLGATYNIPGIATLGKIVPDLATMSAKAQGGVAFTGKPSKLKGWYQYDQQGSDSAIIYVILTKWNAVNNTRDTVADGSFIHNSAQTTYAQFSIDITYQSQSLTPDTMNIIILSSGLSATPNSKLLVDDISFDYPQGITTNDKSDCYIYPNPSNGIVNVSFASNEKYTATLFNSLGQKTHMKNINNSSSTLDLTNLPKGIYLLELKSDNSRTVRKITLK